MKLSCYFLSISLLCCCLLSPHAPAAPACVQAGSWPAGKARGAAVHGGGKEKVPQAMLSCILVTAQTGLPYLCTSCRFSCLRRLCCSPLAAVSFSSSVTRFSRKTTCATGEGRISHPCLNPLAKWHQVPEQLPPPPAHRAGAPRSLWGCLGLLH